MIPADGWRSVSAGDVPMPAIEELRNAEADGFYNPQDAAAETSSQPEIQADYDEEDPNLPGSPVVDHQTADASPATDLMILENQAQYEAFRDPVCNACFASYPAGMVTCPTCDAVQTTQLTSGEQRLAITDVVQASRAEFALQWTEDTAYRGTREPGSRGDLYKHGKKYMKAKKASPDYMGSPNDGNDPWPSCIARYEADESFRRGMILKNVTDQEARLFLARVDEAVRHGPSDAAIHWGIENRRDFLGEERFRLNLVGPDGQVIQRGTNTPARHTLPTFAAVTQGKAGPGKGKPTKGKGKGKGKGKTSAVKGKDKHVSGKPSKDRHQEWLRPADCPGRTTEEQGWNHQEMAWNQCKERSAMRPTEAPPGNWQPARQNTAASSSSSSAPAAPAAATPAVVVETPVNPAPPARPRMFVASDAPPSQGNAPARAASDYSGNDIRRQNRPPPAQTAPDSQPYYHATSGSNRAPEGSWRSRSSTAAQPQSVVPGYRRDQSPWDLLQPSEPKASAPPDQWYGRNTDDQTAEQSLWDGHQGWDTWTQNSWQNGYQ